MLGPHHTDAMREKKTGTALYCPKASIRQAATQAEGRKGQGMRPAADETTQAEAKDLQESQYIQYKHVPPLEMQTAKLGNYGDVLLPFCLQISLRSSVRKSVIASPWQRKWEGQK